MPSSASNSSSETSYLALRAATSIRSMRAAQISVILPCGAGNTLQGLIGSIWSVGPRLGWDAGQYMPYVTGGYASASVENDVVDSGGATIELSEDRLNGWYIGGGFDMSLTEHLKIGVEYRHYEFENDTVTPFNSSGVAVPADRWSLDTNVDSVTARLTYLFGRDRYEPVPLK